MHNSDLDANTQSQSQDLSQSRSVSIAVLYFLIIFFLLLLLLVVCFKVFSPRKPPTLIADRNEIAQRGTIYSSDGFNLSSSKNLYKVSVIKKSIDPDKIDLFIKLFSIYSGMEEHYVREKLEGNGNIILSYSLDPNTARNIRQLNQKFLKYGVFRSYEENGRVVRYGLDVDISGESREYLYSDLIEPILGYTNKQESEGFTKPKGVKGVERFYNSVLESKQDGYYRGDRDVGSNIILSRDAVLKRRIDGQNIVLTIPLKLQKKIENILDESSKDLESKEVVAGIMDSNTGKILALASNQRFNAKRITSSDYPKLNASVVELSFEPGSVMKPIIYSILLDKRLVNPNEIFNIYNGIYKLGSYTIRDSIRKQYASAENIIVLSSNIGMVQMAQRLDEQSYYTGSQSFGFSLPTSQSTFRSYVYKGSVSYGYGLRVTFLQMLRAYAAFANNGYLVTPYLRDYTLSRNNKKIDFDHNNEPLMILSPYTVDRMQKTLIKTVNDGTAKQAKVDGIIIGGKTGTARVTTNGRYGENYTGSFFGFAKDAKSNYTIGVVVFETSAKSSYYASQTAAPIANKIIKAMIEEGYLKPIE